MKALGLIAGLLIAVSAFGDCEMGAIHVPFGDYHQEGAAYVATAVLTPDLYAEYKDVWNLDILSLVYRGRTVATRQNLYEEGSSFELVARVDGETVRCTVDD